MRQTDMTVGQVYAGVRSWYRGPYLLLDKRLYSTINDKVQLVADQPPKFHKSTFERRYEGYLFLEVAQPTELTMADKIKVLRDLDLDDLPRAENGGSYYAPDRNGVEIDGITYWFRTIKGHNIAGEISEVLAKAERERAANKHAVERRQREEEERRRINYTSGVFVRGLLLNAGVQVGDLSPTGDFTVTVNVDNFQQICRVFTTAAE